MMSLAPLSTASLRRSLKISMFIETAGAVKKQGEFCRVVCFVGQGLFSLRYFLTRFSMKLRPLTGAITALATPFKHGQVAYDDLARFIDFQIKSGINGLVPVGTTGESPTLSHEEHIDVIRATIAAARGRVPVLAGTGSNSTAEAL